MLSIKSWMVDELLNMYYTLFNMLPWNTTTQIIKVCSIDVYFFFDSYLYSIKSHQTTIRNFIGCQCSLLLLLTFYDIQYMYMHTLCCLRTIYATYLNSTTKSNNFYNSNQTYKWSVTGTDWGYALIEPALKHYFFNSYANYTGLCIFSEQEYEYILFKQMMQQSLSNCVC